MKTNVFIFLAGLTLGYLSSYIPAFQQENTGDTLPNIEINSATSSKDCSPAVDAIALARSLQIDNTRKQQALEPDKHDDGEHASNLSQDNAAPNSQESTATQQSESIPSPELQEWYANHKTEVRDLFSQISPTNIADSMSEKVLRESQFLNDLEEKLDSNADNEWAYRTKLELENLIASHPLSQDVEVNNISCKQLVCEVISTVHNHESWNEIHFYLLQNATNVQPSWETEDPLLNVHFRDNGTYYSYVLYQFGP